MQRGKPQAWLPYGSSNVNLMTCLAPQLWEDLWLISNQDQSPMAGGEPGSFESLEAGFTSSRSTSNRVTQPKHFTQLRTSTFLTTLLQHNRLTRSLASYVANFNQNTGERQGRAVHHILYRPWLGETVREPYTVTEEDDQATGS